MKRFNESILDPVQDSFSKQIFNGDKIKKEVRNYILDSLYHWADGLKIRDLINGIKLVGSLMTYQYSNTSDLDVNIEISLSDERLERIKKILPNGKLLPKTKHPVNYYLSVTEGTKGTQRGIYDLLLDKWEKKVKKEEIDVFSFYKSCLDQMISWARKIALDIDEINRDYTELKIYRALFEDGDYKGNKEDIKKSIQAKEVELKSDYDILKVDYEVIKAFRNQAFPPEERPFKSKTYKEEEKDFSYNNIVYKMLEKFGYLDMINETLEKFSKEV